MNDVNAYLSGEKLLGNDFDLQEIESWYKDEEEGYSELGAKDKSSYRYGYHALNKLHGYRYIKNKVFKNAFGLGSAYGDEFLPIIDNIKNVTISDPSEAFKNKEVHGVPCKYIKPSIDGVLPFEDNSFDLITCFGVLHHIPNVSTVVNELYRCLDTGGIALIREPIVSMGDWTKPRAGLTKRERGIPIDIFQKIIDDSGFEIVSKKTCVLPPFCKLLSRIKISTYNNNFATLLDSLLCRILNWNIRYHATTITQKIRPASVFYVLRKTNN